MRHEVPGQQPGVRVPLRHVLRAAREVVRRCNRGQLVRWGQVNNRAAQQPTEVNAKGGTRNSASAAPEPVNPLPHACPPPLRYGFIASLQRDNMDLETAAGNMPRVQINVNSERELVFQQQSGSDSRCI